MESSSQEANIQSKNEKPKQHNFFRRHKLLTALGAFGLVGAVGVAWVSMQEKYSEDNCTDLTHVQIDISDGTLSNIARKLHNRWNGGSLQDVAEYVTDQRGYYVNQDTVVEMNSKFSQFAENPFKPGVYCLSIPEPQTKNIDGVVLVKRTKPEDIGTLVLSADGEPDLEILKAITVTNAQAWVESGLSELPDMGYYPVDNNIISWVSNQPGITLEAINKTKEQANQLGLIG